MMQPNPNQQGVISKMANGATDFMNNMNQGYRNFVNSPPSQAFIKGRNALETNVGQGMLGAGKDLLGGVERLGTGMMGVKATGYPEGAVTQNLRQWKPQIQEMANSLGHNVSQQLNKPLNNPMANWLDNALANKVKK